MNVDWKHLLDDCVDFAQRLIQTPSMPFAEAEIAEVVAAECRALDFDEVWLDEISNVNGRLKGSDPTLGALVLNTHLDHVDPGEPSLWSVPPYSGEVVDGRLFGRGACDIKGPMAVQIYSMAALKRVGIRPRRDIVFSGVVQEEVGGAGAVHWVENLDYEVDLVVLGEPSNNQIALGHRGIVQMWLTFHGRSVHASVPQAGQNPNWALADFLKMLESEKTSLKSHPILGKTTIAPTIIEVDTKSPNVTPAWTRVLLDVRTGTESLNSLQSFVHQLVGDWPHSISDAWCAPDTPLANSDDTIFGFYTPPENEMAVSVQKILSEAVGHEVPFSSYQFATDGRHFVPHNLTLLGYAASEENQAHVVDESISLSKMEESLRGHIALLQKL